MAKTKSTTAAPILSWTGSDDSSPEEDAVLSPSQKPARPSKPKPTPNKTPAAGADSEEGSDDSSPEEDAVLPPSQKPARPSKKKPTSNKTPAAGEESEEGSDDSDSDSLPLSSKRPVVNKHSVKAAVNPKGSTPAKRALPVDADLPSKKKKQRASQGGAIQKMWSDEDEINILQGMIVYKAAKGADPISDTKGFHEFIKGGLHFAAGRKQLVDKICILRLRYDNLKKHKRTLSFHENATTELSKLIWEPNPDNPAETTPAKKSKSKAKASNGDVKAKASNGDVKAKVSNGDLEIKASNGDDVEEEAGEDEVMEEEEEDDNDDGGDDTNDACETVTVKSGKFIGKGSISMGLDETIVIAGLALCSDASKAEIEKKWKQLYLEKAALFGRKLDLVREESNLITQALKNME